MGVWTTVMALTNRNTSLVDHGETVSTPSTVFYHDTAMLHKQALAVIHDGNPATHPRQLKKIIGDRLAKCIFVTKNALYRRLRATESTFESRFVRGSRFGRLWP